MGLERRIAAEAEAISDWQRESAEGEVRMKRRIEPRAVPVVSAPA